MPGVIVVGFGFAGLRDCRTPLAGLLDPAGVGHLTSEATGIAVAARTVSTAAAAPQLQDRPDLGY